MPTLETRKILKLGGSLAVTLPLGWTVYNRLAPGDRLEIRTNGKLTIRPIRQRDDAKGKRAR